MMPDREGWYVERADVSIHNGGNGKGSGWFRVANHDGSAVAYTPSPEWARMFSHAPALMEAVRNYLRVMERPDFADPADLPDLEHALRDALARADGMAPPCVACGAPDDEHDDGCPVDPEQEERTEGLAGGGGYGD